MEGPDWVTECRRVRERLRVELRSCAERLFRDLADRVKRDVEIFNEGERTIGVQCVFSVVEGDVFSVRRDNHASKTFLKFTLNGIDISARRSGFRGVDRVEGEAVLIGAECRISVKDKPMEPWEFSKLVLEPLFFPGDET